MKNLFMFVLIFGCSSLMMNSVFAAKSSGSHFEYTKNRNAKKLAKMDRMQCEAMLMQNAVSLKLFESLVFTEDFSDQIIGDTIALKLKIKAGIETLCTSEGIGLSQKEISRINIKISQQVSELPEDQDSLIQLLDDLSKKNEDLLKQERAM